jgi:hypothetical protein
VSDNAIGRNVMDRKQRNWVTAVISLGAAYLLLWMVAFFYADILPKLLVVTMGALMVVAVIAPTLVFAFGPASLLARYPATVRPLAQAQSSMLVIWIAGSGLFSVVRGTLPERLAEISLGRYFDRWICTSGYERIWIRKLRPKADGSSKTRGARGVAELANQSHRFEARSYASPLGVGRT